MIRTTTKALPRVQWPDLDGVARDAQTHDRLCAGIDALHQIELGGTAPTVPLDFPIRVAAWNLERCLDPQASAKALRGRDLVLLSEMDCGMARTGQAHGTAEIARDLGMAYAYGIEFLELGLGSAIERAFCLDDANARGFHGNAVLAGGPLEQVFALRLPGHRQWFTDPEQPRLGERLAIGAQVATRSGPVLAISTHLESACQADHRARQMAGLIAEIDASFPGLPVLIGGDLNTGNHAGGDWRAEGLFAQARAAGFTVHGGPEDMPTTRASRLTRFPERAMKLDWFLSRGLDMGETRIAPAVDDTGAPLSDHERIEVEILGLSAAPQ